ncbi:MAG: ABC transporter permease [Acidobacteriota bacterium]|nr:ABC transporter permease [Acidobacteriota bacterium]
MKNLRYALRTLFRTPFVTIVAIVSLALGIGANAAIFSLFNQMLLKPLAAHKPHELVNLSSAGPKSGSVSCNNAGDCNEVFSYAMFRDLESKGQGVFTSVAAHRLFGANFAYDGQTQSGEGVLVSGSYFPVLGLQPALGRLIAPSDDRAIGESGVVVLSYSWWRINFQQNPALIGKRLMVNGTPMEIIGVAPEGFNGTTLGSRPQVFVPITLRSALDRNYRAGNFANRQNYWIYLFARLKPGVGRDQARAGINQIYSPIMNTVEAPIQRGMSDQTMAKFRAKTLELSTGTYGQSSVRTDSKPYLNALLGVTALVLLIACANIANLLLARSAGRAGEMALRLSIGANRRQLVSQLLTESVTLAVLGGAAGILVARWTLDGIASLLPADTTQSLDFVIDWPVIAFVGALALGTGVLFGLFPALHSTRPELLPTLKGNAGQPGGSRAASRFRATLATSQIFLSMALLVGAGLFTKSLYNISKVDLGLRVENLVTFRVSPVLNGYTQPQSAQFFERLEDELAATPGVTAVTASLVPALAGSNWGTDVAVQGWQSGPDIDSNAQFNEVGAGYFTTMGMRVLAGREFVRGDQDGAPRVAVVNEAFAKKFNMGADVVGKRIGIDNGNELNTEIVGLIQNAKYSQVDAREQPVLFYTPHRQDPSVGSMSFYVRTSLDPAQLLATVPRVVAKLDPNLPVDEARTMAQQVKENTFEFRFISVLSAAFATLATVLAAIGLYGVLAYTVSQRTREIGLRMALGAAPNRVRVMVLTQVAVMTLVGGGIGLLAGYALGRYAESQGMLFQLQGAQGPVLLASAVILSVVSLSAGLIPAIRASRIDPMRALRFD